MIRGKLIAITTHQKKLKQAAYFNLTGKLKNLEISYQSTQNTELSQKIKTTKTEIDEILRGEIEKKLRYVRQEYYETGPKATRLLARRIKKQQTLNTIHKIRDPQSGELKYKTKEIENIFKEYYKNLYTQTSSSSEEAKRRFLNIFDLPTIGQ